MKILKKILLVIVVLIVIVLIAALFVKKEYEVAREVVINKPRQEVFSYVKQLKNQDNYNKWIMVDPAAKREFTGTDGTVGFVYAWDGKEAGKGNEKITSLTEGERVDMKLTFIEPMEGDANAYITTTDAESGHTKVKWAMYGVSKYPMNFMNLFIGNILGKDLSESLTNLKNTLEKQ